jgi:hypothetical protein
MRPANELTHQIGKIWPENPRKTDDGGESFLGKRRLRKADRARTMLGAVPALNRAPIAPLPAWPEIKTRTLVAGAPVRWRRKLEWRFVSSTVGPSLLECVSCRFLGAHLR